MARQQYKFLKGQTDDAGKWTFNAKMTGTAIEASFPKCARSSEHYANIAYRLAARVASGEFAPKPKKSKRGEVVEWDPFAEVVPREHEFLFILARELMGTTKSEHRRTRDMATSLAPYALVYVEGLQLHQAYPETSEKLNWDDDEEVIETFVAVYRKVRYASDETLPSLTMDKAVAHPLRIKGKGEKMLKFLSFAYHLQVAQGESAIALPVEQMGALLGCAPTFVSQMIANSVTDGYLEPVNQKYSRARGRAKTYRFVVGRLSKGEIPK